MTGTAFLPLAQAIAAHLSRAPAADGAIDTERRRLRRAAANAVPREAVDVAAGRDYAAILGQAIAAARVHDCGAIADALAALPLPLPWQYHYAPRPGEADLADRIAFAEIIGPAAPLHAPDGRIGFTLMAPATFYPLHAHPAVELYLVIAGCARWTTPDADRIVPPGQYVLHRSDEPHAMRTYDEPLLALYGWSGAIDAPARYL